MKGMSEKTKFKGKSDDRWGNAGGGWTGRVK